MADGQFIDTWPKEEKALPFLRTFIFLSFNQAVAHDVYILG